MLKHPRIKYQVFVSSTYVDLREERERVVWAVLEARHIPAGMENFTATDERGWKTITRVIDDTDYYVLILAGLYGTVDSNTGISWTQREYEYAISKNIPVLAFIREPSAIRGDMVERDPHKTQLLKTLIDKIKSNHLYKSWKSIEELSSAVASALRNHIQDDIDDGTPRPGWVRGDSIPSAGSIDEFARLSAENAKLKSEMEALQHPPTKTELHLVENGSEQPFSKLTYADRKHYSFSKQVRDRYSEYLDIRNRTVWINISIKNTGAVAARNIAVDFKIPDAHAIILELVKPPGDPTHATTKIKTDPTQHCYIDYWSSTSIRQRLRHAAPHVTEKLMTFGVVLKKAVPGGMEKLDIDYLLADESGVISKSAFSVELGWTAPVSISRLTEIPDSPY